MNTSMRKIYIPMAVKTTFPDSCIRPPCGDHSSFSFRKSFKTCFTPKISAGNQMDVSNNFAKIEIAINSRWVTLLITFYFFSFFYSFSNQGFLTPPHL